MPVTASPPQMPTRWLTVYRVWMGLVGVLAAVAGAVMIFRPRSGENWPAGLLGFVLGIALLSVSIGLGLRRLWAWRLNYWGGLLVSAILGGVLALSSAIGLLLAVTGIGPVLLVGPAELLRTLWLGLVFGGAAILNMRYFRRRRALFS